MLWNNNDKSVSPSCYVCAMNLYDQIFEASAHLEAFGFDDAEIGIVLGTGLGQLIEEVKDHHVIPYEAIPHFSLSTVESHAGKLIRGVLFGRRVIVMQGRFHYYEGHSMQQVAFPIRVMQRLGVRHVFLSGAAGNLNRNWSKGELMLLSDHINLQPSNPLLGLNDTRLGPRFLDMSDVYDKTIRERFNEAASVQGIQLRNGVYVSVPGPMLESAAEYRFLHKIGADAVGMSTVPEVMVARHGGMSVSAIVVLTDDCDPDDLKPIQLSEIVQLAAEAEVRLIALLSSVMPNL